MQITKHKVVSIDYTLKDTSGGVLDSSEGRDPLSYLHGTGSLIPGLEKELEGKETGDHVDVTVPPDQAYGQRNEALKQDIPRQDLGNIEQLEPGMRLQVNSQNGPVQLTVVDVTEEQVTVDGNHPLAGKELNFSVDVREVREPTDEELAHGHAHAPGGSEH